MTHAASCAWVHIGSSNGVLPDGTWPLCEPVLTFYVWGTVAFAWLQFCNEFPIYYYVESVQKHSLKSRPHLPGDNELNSTVPVSVYAFVATGHNICIEKHTSSFFFFFVCVCVFFRFLFFPLLSFLWVLSKMCFPANIRSSIWIFND